ncbi:hypothetical protein NIES4101_49580 [Calothrix sp. NIES-4101]|nr:hypothetical protein NIES4101_49580 [Calothrix sp. NIES-4101]
MISLTLAKRIESPFDHALMTCNFEMTRLNLLKYVAIDVDILNQF